MYAGFRSGHCTAGLRDAILASGVAANVDGCWVSLLYFKDYLKVAKQSILKNSDLLNIK